MNSYCNLQGGDKSETQAICCMGDLDPIGLAKDIILAVNGASHILNSYI